MKTKKELEALKQKVDDLKCELRELTEEELNQVIGGVALDKEFFLTLGIGGGIFTPTGDISDDTADNSGKN